MTRREGHTHHTHHTHYRHYTHTSHTPYTPHTSRTLYTPHASRTPHTPHIHNMSKQHALCTKHTPQGYTTCVHTKHSHRVHYTLYHTPGTALHVGTKYTRNMTHQTHAARFSPAVGGSPCPASRCSEWGRCGAPASCSFEKGGGHHTPSVWAEVAPLSLSLFVMCSV